MDERPGIVPFDLEVPRKSMWEALTEPWLCPVCGRVRPGLVMTPLRIPLPGQRRQEREHDSCDRQIDDWMARALLVDDDVDYRAALAVVQAARELADRIWEGKLRAIGLPDWVVDRQIARHRDPEWC